ncbi:hypothetical protein BHE74_00055462 [Ensete ventricosum]|nr:hypothetical protein BHE74_00055462 [Ensete ventricosum]
MDPVDLILVRLVRNPCARTIITSTDLLTLSNLLIRGINPGDEETVWDKTGGGTLSILNGFPLEHLPSASDLARRGPHVRCWVERLHHPKPRCAVLLCRPPSKGGERAHPIAASSTLLFSQVHLWPITSPFPPFLSLFLSPLPLPSLY